MIYIGSLWGQKMQIITLNHIWPKTLLSAEREGYADHKFKPSCGPLFFVYFLFLAKIMV